MMTKHKDKRKGRPADWGLLNRVAKRLGVSRSLVSRVNRGLMVSARVSRALAEERKAK